MQVTRKFYHKSESRLSIINIYHYRFILKNHSNIFFGTNYRHDCRIDLCIGNIGEKKIRFLTGVIKQHMNLTFVRNRVMPVRIDMASIFTTSTDDQKAYDLKTSLSKEIYWSNAMVQSFLDRKLLIIITIFHTEHTNELNDTQVCTVLLRIISDVGLQ